MRSKQKLRADMAEEAVKMLNPDYAEARAREAARKTDEDRAEEVLAEELAEEVWDEEEEAEPDREWVEAGEAAGG